jgi:DNA-binding helix-turn-helix protein
MEKNIKIDVKKFVVSRLNNGLTKKDLALKTGVSLSIISNFEKGRSIPRPKALKIICDELNLKMEDVVNTINM